MRIKKISQIAGTVGSIVNSYSTSSNDAYCSSYINDKIEPVSYALTDTPAHSAGTNLQNIYKIGKLVVMNCNLWCNNLTQNSWTEIGTLPADIIPSYEVHGMATLVSGATGNYTGLGLIGTYNGKLRIKPNIAVSSLTGIRLNITYTL